MEVRFYLVDGELSDDNVMPIKTYISRILLTTQTTETAAKFYLEDQRFTVIDANLSAGIQERATYIGIQTTDDTSAALTDLRIAYGTNQESIIYGDISYGAWGFSGLEPGKGDDNKQMSIDAAEYTLYATNKPDRGSPIYSNIKVRTSANVPNLGDEPINLFSGGGAFNFNVSRNKRAVEIFILIVIFMLHMYSLPQA